MPPVFVPFDGWSPGRDYFGEGWVTATNIYPAFGAHKPWRKFVHEAGTSSGRKTGGHVHLWTTGAAGSPYMPDAATIFAGDDNALYTVNPTGGAFTDISRGGGYAAAGNPAGWRFASVGNDIWACNWLDVMQRRTNNAGNFANGVASTFVPIPRHLAVIREHLVVGNLNQVGRFQDEIAWSDADDATNFDPPTGTSTSLAGSKRLISIPGQITGMVGGQYGLVFKRRAIFYLEYAGPPAIFRPDILSPHIGTAHPSSIINSRYGVFFLGSDGFYQIRGLSEPVKISDLWSDQLLIDSNFSTLTALGQVASAEDTRIIGFQFPGMPLIGWMFVRSTFLNGTNEIYLHNPVTGAWSYNTAAVTSHAALPSVVLQLPYATTVYDSLAVVTWDASFSRYAKLAETATNNMQAPLLQLRFRPANFDEVHHQKQSIVTGVLPVFSKSLVSSTALTETVTVDSLLDPHNDVWKTEGPRLASERDTVSGMFPFEITGRFFRINIACAAEDFSDFHGCWVDQRLLT